MALLEGDDLATGRVRYFYSSENSEFMRAFITAKNVSVYEARIRNGKYQKDLEEYMAEVDGSDTKFLFFTDFKFLGEQFL